MKLLVRLDARVPNMETKIDTLADQLSSLTLCLRRAHLQLFRPSPMVVTTEEPKLLSFFIKRVLIVTSPATKPIDARIVRTGEKDARIIGRLDREWRPVGSKNSQVTFQS